MISGNEAGLLGNIYASAYRFACGKNPRQNILHFQWLSARHLNKSVPRVLGGLGGDLLDVGCGEKPYKKFFKGGKYVGLDVYGGPGVDLVVSPGEKWPLPDGSFDAVLCTQVLEHSSDFSHVCGEMSRVLKKGGSLVVSVPFIYGEHGAPDDYWRFSFYGAKALFKGYREERAEKQGGIGSSLAILFLNWLDTALNRNVFTRILKGLLLPLTILVSFLANVLAALADAADFTGSFYSNSLIVLRKE